MFSATGKMLSGTERRPDIFTIYTQEEGRKKVGMGASEQDAMARSRLNICGYIPGVSTLTGAGRSLLGTVHTIVHLASAMFDSKNRSDHLAEAALGGKNMLRGLVETVPVIGNIATFTHDNKRSQKFNKRNRIYMKASHGGKAIVLGNGKEIVNCSLETFNKRVKELSKEKSVSTNDKIQIIREESILEKKNK